jgi:hypothetical protein
VTGLFTNNLSIYGVLDQAPAYPTAAAWYGIQQYVSPGFGWDWIWAAGVGGATSTPTGRAAFGLTEYTIAVPNLYIPLPPGDYWMAVVPICYNGLDPYCYDEFFLSDVEYLNVAPASKTGPVEPLDASYFDSPYFGYYYGPTWGGEGACYGYGCDAFSAGVQGTKE